MIIIDIIIIVVIIILPLLPSASLFTEIWICSNPLSPGPFSQLELQTLVLHFEALALESDRFVAPWVGAAGNPRPAIRDRSSGAPGDRTCPIAGTDNLRSSFGSLGVAQKEQVVFGRFDQL